MRIGSMDFIITEVVIVLISCILAKRSWMWQHWCSCTCSMKNRTARKQSVRQVSRSI